MGCVHFDRKDGEASGSRLPRDGPVRISLHRSGNWSPMGFRVQCVFTENVGFQSEAFQTLTAGSVFEVGEPERRRHLTIKAVSF